MNLVKDVWLPVVRQNGEKDKIAICQLLAEYDVNPVVEILSPRPDFKNALYQLLIGIVQVVATPEDEEEWAELFDDPYSASDFSRKVLAYEDCFEIDSKGPAFMQDYDMPEDCKEESLKNLFINLPANEHYTPADENFVKGEPHYIDGYWAAVALYTLQTFAPSGGSGYRVGLRGGGPLTTIVLPQQEATLWKKLWLNVLSQEKVSLLLGDLSRSSKEDIFPWMKETKISKNGKQLFSSEVHPFYHYFGMPRRMRLIFSDEKGCCDISGVESKNLVKAFRVKNLGNNYDGAWTHPLNAYSFDPKKPDELPLSIKAQPGGIGYRHWLGQTLESYNVAPAIVVQQLMNNSHYRRDIARKCGVKLWVAGFDMSNMKARCWYDSIMPFYALSSNQALMVQQFVEGIIAATNNLLRSIKGALKSAWANRPKDLSGDFRFIDNSFWGDTEGAFYDLLDDFIENIEDSEKKKELLDSWWQMMKPMAEDIFDNAVFAQQEDGLNMKRVMKARDSLGKGIEKFIKDLRKIKEKV